MKSHTVYKTFNTERRREFVRITEDVERAVEESGIAEGMALVSAMHITAGVWVNDHIPLAAEMPHGGYKQSGYGKDLSIYSLEDYTQIKHVMVSLS